MNMSIRKCESQLYFENMISSQKKKQFNMVHRREFKDIQFTDDQAKKIRDLLKEEIAPYYYKSLLSYIESLDAIQNRLYSWATIRLYYSTFYSIKAYLACKDVAIFRAQRKLFYVKAKGKESLKSCEQHTDHKGAITTHKKLFKDIDMLFSNSVGDFDAYEWMMNKREEVNYKDLNFHDPVAPEFWSKLSEEIEDNGIGKMVERLVDDDGTYCFQDEYAILGIPTKRIILTVDEMCAQGKTFDILEEKREFIDSMSNILTEKSIRALEIWKRVQFGQGTI